MNSVNRLSLLACVGIVVAGLAHAGWLAGLWLIAHADAPAHGVWLPLAAQIGITLALAAAVGHTLRRELKATQRSIAALEQQAAALEQGRFVLVEHVDAEDVSPLAWRMNALVRRLQQTHAPAAPSDAIAVLRRAAPADPETGVESRFTFLRNLTERLADKGAPQTALVVVRLLGARKHPTGAEAEARADAVDKLVQVLREYPGHVEGAFVGRLADGDFALCLPAHGIAADTAASVLAALQTPPGRVRSVAAAIDELGTLPLSSALAIADAAIARAEAGGNGCIEARSANEAAAPASNDGEMRKAIVEALRGGHWQLAEFPVLDAVGRLLHLECPMRLQLGGRFEPAATWLAVASRYRLMTQIDLCGVELALAACDADGVGRCVHVSSESLATAGFVSAVRARLEANPMAAARLWIEISEVSFERLPPRLRNAGTVWRRCGARVGIEHAGAALRSLVRVGELDLDYVKVDAGYVQGIAHDTPQLERARGLVAFVHEMGARVIAEGVDDVDDLAVLWQLGFDGATGKVATQQYRGHDSRPAPLALPTPAADEAPAQPADTIQ